MIASTPRKHALNENLHTDCVHFIGGLFLSGADEDEVQDIATNLSLSSSIEGALKKWEMYPSPENYDELAYGLSSVLPTTRPQGASNRFHAFLNTVFCESTVFTKGIFLDADYNYLPLKHYEDMASLNLAFRNSQGMHEGLIVIDDASVFASLLGSFLSVATARGYKGISDALSDLETVEDRAHLLKEASSLLEQRLVSLGKPSLKRPLEEDEEASAFEESVREYKRYRSEFGPLRF